MSKPLSSWNQFAQEKRLEGLPFEKIGELWKGTEGAKWREEHLGDGAMPMPTYDALLWPGLQALKESNQPLNIQEHLAAVIRLMDIPPRLQRIMHGNSEQTEVQYRLAWARTYLNKAGAIENVDRGIWRCTPFGETLSQAEVMEIPAKVRKGDYSGGESPVYDRILKTVKELEGRGDILPDDVRQGYYDLFREKFGPDVLMTLDGEELLSYMHDHSNYDSLVYWLEFKNDAEFPAIFGSIAGGSALKFGIYRRKETGKWMKGHPTKQVELSIDEAVNIAKMHREQLIRGVELLKQMPADADAEDYRKLEEAMFEETPDVAYKAWGHKYFSLMFPDILDDFHNFQLQQFHLTKLLLDPPKKDGRYQAAQFFISVAQVLGIHVHSLTVALNHLHPVWHSYWRLGTKLGGKQDIWEDMKSGGYIAVGWSDVGNLEGLAYNRKDIAKVKERLSAEDSKTPQHAGNQASQLLNFAAGTKENDIVFVSDGHHVRGIAKITGAYEYHPGSEFPHRKPVDWLSLEEWDMPVWKGLVPSTIRAIGHEKYSGTLIEAERRLLEGEIIGKGHGPGSQPPTHQKLVGIPARIQTILERKKQAILFGPPGTGKTYWAMDTARELAARSNFNASFDNLSSDEQTIITGSDEKFGLIRTCCFHPEYGYENFIEGYAPTEKNGQVAFHLENGLFKQICIDAARPENANLNFYLIIDEINRGDIPRIFGELLMLLEADKRGLSLTLPISKKPFKVPENVFLLGTMNTADRSIALLDTALRRRFGFVELMPEPDILEDTVIEGIPLRLWLKSLNERIRQNIGHDARNLQIGHAYFMPGGKTVSTMREFARILRDDIVPLLEEYCYEDYGLLTRILGSAFIDEKGWRVRQDLFDSPDSDKLVKALLALNPEIATSDKSVEAEEDTPGEDNEEEDTEIEDEANDV
ncbi:MAG TPA: AAA family ATPase [Syntrophus sp. (in: bacteria)]|jgi:5-methylcytosine-specific restriction protein B|nr:AAA family ATPase [Syntrophus sp. (in: bacteria)]